MSRSVLAGATALALSFGPVAGVLIVLGGTSPSSQKEPQTAQEAFQSITKDWSKRYTTAKNEFLQEVRFSGQFTLRANKDCFSEYSMTESGSMTSPGYTFKFTAVKPR
jgi:hypothetical protein